MSNEQTRWHWLFKYLICNTDNVNNNMNLIYFHVVFIKKNSYRCQDFSLFFFSVFSVKTKIGILFTLFYAHYRYFKHKIQPCKKDDHVQNHLLLKLNFIFKFFSFFLYNFLIFVFAFQHFIRPFRMQVFDQYGKKLCSRLIHSHGGRINNGYEMRFGNGLNCTICNYIECILIHIKKILYFVYEKKGAKKFKILCGSYNIMANNSFWFFWKLFAFHFSMVRWNQTFSLLKLVKIHKF